jgi:hypothetical protein
MKKGSPKRNYYSKEQIQEPTTKYIPPHLRKVDKTQDPRKEERKPTVPPTTMTGKLQPKDPKA